MNNDEKELSNYIDKLNRERKPKEHENSANSLELEKCFDTVRLVRSLKEPVLPDTEYPKKLAKAVADSLPQKTTSRTKKRVWLMSTAAAVIAVVVMFNFILTFNKTNIAYAMEKAFQGVKAYHGLLEIVETNGEGKASTQAKLEVWGDSEGRYYIKEIEGSQQGLITVNNGQKKWQLQPDQKQAYIFPAFPDAYRFIFELGKEVDEVKNALKFTEMGEEMVSGRTASVLEVSPKGGVPYRLWIDKETKLPLQKQSGMQNALQLRVTYTDVDFSDVIPEQFITYGLPEGFEETSINPEQIVTNIGEAQEIAGFTLKVPENIPQGYSSDSIAVETDTKTVKLNFVTQDKTKRIVVLQNKSAKEFKPASTAVLGKIDNSTSEIQSPVQEGSGILGGGGPYAGVTDIRSIRWQQNGFEYAVVGNVPLIDMVQFVKSLNFKDVQITADETKHPGKPQIEVPIDLEVEGNDQKSADSGHSPWKLDPVFVAHVFVSLKMSPEGINGEYPIEPDEFTVTQNNGQNAIVKVNGDKTPIRTVYLKRLIRQDSTGIWTVVGYDPVDKK